MSTQNDQSNALGRELSAPIDYSELRDVKVGGTGMDYHGNGLPTASLRRLARRRREVGNQTMDGEGVLIGLVDGAFTDHPWLDGGYLASPNEFESFTPPCDGPFALPAFSGHATFITGLILQQAPAAGVWVERVLRPDGKATAAEVLDAVRTLAERGVQIINLSLGCFDDDDSFTVEMQAAFDTVLTDWPGLVIVAAAGNLSPGVEPQRFWPAACEGVVSVGSVSDDHPTRWADWSNFGDWVQFAADGKNLLSTFLDRRVLGSGKEVDFKGWARWSGTSFSTAIVSGAIARTMTDSDVSARDAVKLLEKNAEVRIGADNTPFVRREVVFEELLQARAEKPSRVWAARYRKHRGFLDLVRSRVGR